MGVGLRQCPEPLRSGESVEKGDELGTQTLAKAGDAKQTKQNNVIVPAKKHTDGLQCALWLAYPS